MPSALPSSVRMPTLTRRRRPMVALIAWYESIMRGVLDYVHSCHPPPFAIEIETTELLSHLDDWPGDALIAPIESPEAIKQVRRWNKPVVNLSGKVTDPGLPGVLVDDLTVGRLAADYLVGKGLRNMGVVVVPEFNYSVQRAQAFEQVIHQAGLNCQRLSLPPYWNRLRQGQMYHQKLGRWLQSLAKPAGIMVSTDQLAVHVLEMAQNMDMKIPDDLAVLAVAHQDLLLESMSPPLSSVDTHMFSMGYEAAAMLHRLLQNQPLPAKTVLVKPRGVVERKSTDIQAINDPMVRLVLLLIRQHFSEPNNVKWILEQVPASRSVIEKRFHQAVGHSPHDMLTQIRVEKAKHLLVETDMDGEAISNACGFSYRSHFHRVFMAQTGMSPRNYRLRYRRR